MQDSTNLVESQGKKEKKGRRDDPPTAASAPLPCLSENNCRKPINTDRDKNPVKLKSAQYKAVWAMRQNTQTILDDIGRKNAVFFTGTPKSHITCKRAFARYFKRFRNHFKEIGIDIHEIVKESQGSGRLHFHAIADLGQDVWTGFDFKTHANVKRVGEKIYHHGGFENAPKHLIKLYRKLSRVRDKSGSAKLRSVWHAVRRAAAKSGFGRCEVIPVQDAKAVGDYIGGYLGKSLAKKTPETKGMRKINYARHAKRKVKGAFSWVNGTASVWRANLGDWAKFQKIGVNDYDTLRRRFGKSWAYNLYEKIMHEGERERILGKMGQDVINRWGDMWAARRRYDYIAFGGDPTDPDWDKPLDLTDEYNGLVAQYGF
jgi:hypothetical protein